MVAWRLRWLPLRTLRMRLARLRGLWRLRRLLLLVGTLPPLLRARVPTTSKDMICLGRVSLDPASICLLMGADGPKALRGAADAAMRAAGMPAP
jgi:hypothetical protein